MVFALGGAIARARPSAGVVGSEPQDGPREVETWSGHIVDRESLEPIPGAQITVEVSGAWPGEAAPANPQPTAPVAVADADGSFEIEAARGTRLQLSAERFAAGFVELTPARETDLGTLVLRRARFLGLGGCLLQAGVPATGAGVAALSFTRSDEDAAPAPTTVSDENGCFRLDGIRPQRPLRLISVTGGIAQSLDLGGGLSARHYELGEIHIAPVRRLIGRVVDAHGMPLSGVTVWLHPEDSPLFLPEPTEQPELEGISPLRTISDSDGRVELSAFAGTYTLFAFKRGLAPARWRIHLADRDARTDVGDMILQAGIPLRGRVVDGAGAPLAGARVSLQSAYGWPSPYWGPGYWIPPDAPVVTTDVDGCFVLPGLLPGMRPQLGSELAGYVARTWLHNEPLEPLPVAAPGPCGGAAGEIEMRREGRIRGTVVDQRGRPAPGVEVSFSRVESVPDGARSAPPRPVTGPEGTFVIADLVPGSYELGLSAYGYLHERVDGVTVAPGETTAVAIAVTRIAERQPLDVRVFDHRGAPVPGARVVAAIQSGRWRSFTPSPAAVTGADGRVRFPDAPLATYEIRADADGVRSDPTLRSASALAADDAPVVLRLPPSPERRAFSVSGRLLDAGGEGVSAARLKLMEDELGGEERETISEAGGAFRFDAVPPGRYLLRAARRGFPEVLHATVLDVVASGIEDVVVDIPVAGTINGSVAGLPRSGAAGLRIDAVSTAPVPVGVGNSISGTGWVDANGGFRVTNLAPGSWRLRAETSSGRSAETVVQVERPGADAEAILVFPPAFTLTGRVRWRGGPLESALVSVGSADAGGGSAFTDGSGRFTIPELPAARYGVSVSLRGTVFDADLMIDLGTNESIDFEIRGGSVAGRLIDADSGQPIAGAFIRTGALGRQGHYTWIDRTDPSGHFRTRPLAAGPWRLDIAAPGYARRRPVIDVADEDIDDVQIELRRSAGLSLRVASPAAIAGDLDLLWQDQSTGDVLWTIIHDPWRRVEDGGFLWEEVPFGRGLLTVADRQAGLVARFVVANEGEPVDVSLRAAGSLHLAVAALVDDPAMPATLRLYDDDDVAVAWRGETRIERIKYGDFAGQFLVPVLAPGSLRAEVTADDGRVWSRRIEIRPGERTRVTLR